MSEASETRGGEFKLRSFWGVVLAVSLIANAFVLAHIGGRVIFGPPDHPGKGGNPIHAFLMERPELRPVYEEALGERSGGMREAWREISGEIQALNQLIGAESLDIEAIEAKQERLLELHDERRRIADARLRAFVEALSPDARRDFAAFLEERSRRRREFWRKRRKEREGSE